MVKNITRHFTLCVCRLSVDAEALIERIGKLGEVISDNMKR